MPEPMSGCWLWMGSVTAKGYGNFTRDRRTHYAHRCAYEAEHGLGSAFGKVVRHRCDNPCCCNPDHLVAGTYQDNSDDAKRRGRLAHLKGEASGRAILTDNVVMGMRERAESGVPHSRIAKEHGITNSAGRSAIVGESWSHLGGIVAAPGHPKGERLPQALLTEDDVREIRRRRSDGENVRLLADGFGVGVQAIYAILSGRNWSHVK